MRITTAMVEEVERLLAEGALSQRKIAKHVGMSRGTVNAIALGRRPKTLASSNEPSPFDWQGAPLVRCPGCGGKVFLPCLLCHIRALKDRDSEIRHCTHLQQSHAPAPPQSCSTPRDTPNLGSRFVAATPSALVPVAAPQSSTLG